MLDVGTWTSSQPAESTSRPRHQISLYIVQNDSLRLEFRELKLVWYFVNLPALFIVSYFSTLTFDLCEYSGFQISYHQLHTFLAVYLFDFNIFWEKKIYQKTK